MSTGSENFYQFRIHKNEMIFLSTIHNPIAAADTAGIPAI